MMALRRIRAECRYWWSARGRGRFFASSGLVLGCVLLADALFDPDASVLPRVVGAAAGVLAIVSSLHPRIPRRLK